MIPQEKSAAVTRGLREAFGVTAFEDIRRLTKGHTSTLVFRIVVRGSPFLLRIIMSTDDPTCHFTCMKAADEASLAPHVWYTSVENHPRSNKTGGSGSAIGMTQVLAWGDAIANELLEFFDFRKPPLIVTGPDTVIIDTNLKYTSGARH